MQAFASAENIAIKLFNFRRQFYVGKLFAAVKGEYAYYAGEELQAEITEGYKKFVTENADKVTESMLKKPAVAQNHRITAVDMHKENLNADKLVRYPHILRESFDNS